MLDLMNGSGRLDLRVADDTGVDFAALHVQCSGCEQGCAEGSAGRGSGRGPFEVLTINGSAGNGFHTVPVAAFTPFVAELEAAPTATCSPCLGAFFGLVTVPRHPGPRPAAGHRPLLLLPEPAVSCSRRCR